MKQEWRPKGKLFSQENLNRIQLKHLHWLQNLEIYFIRKNVFRICFTMNTRDRDTGQARQFWGHKDFCATKFKSTRDILTAVRRTAKFIVAHEIDESLYLDNQRIFDPHKK